MKCDNHTTRQDHGQMPYVANINEISNDNTNFRTTIWTGCHLQMTLMCISVCDDIGLEIHPDTDQFIRIEQGHAIVKMGKRKDCLDFQRNICKNDAVFIPAGTWHNIINIGNEPLKLSSIYAPPHHKKGTIHQTKKDAEREEY